MVSSGTASRALPYTLQAPCRWRSSAFPPLWSLRAQRLVPPPQWGRCGGTPSSKPCAPGHHRLPPPEPPKTLCLGVPTPPQRVPQHPFGARRTPPRPPPSPLPVLVGAEDGLQRHPLLLDGSLAGQRFGGNIGGWHLHAPQTPSPRPVRRGLRVRAGFAPTPSPKSQRAPSPRTPKPHGRVGGGSHLHGHGVGGVDHGGAAGARVDDQVAVVVVQHGDGHDFHPWEGQVDRQTSWQSP